MRRAPARPRRRRPALPLLILLGLLLAALWGLHAWFFPSPRPAPPPVRVVR